MFWTRLLAFSLHLGPFSPRFESIHKFYFMGALNVILPVLLGRAAR